VSGWRLPHGGAIDRSSPLCFKWDGTTFSGYDGDTLASALLASGQSVFGRSFKYHRPRGLFSAGPEEPGALFRVRSRGGEDPALPATIVELEHELEAWSVNCWPSPRFDLGGIAQIVAPLLRAGFYYKTFKWPDWHLYEPAIRKAAGIGRAPLEADRQDYDVVHAHCDVLVVGGGPAGLAAAAAAGSTGARVFLAEQDTLFGGGLLSEDGLIVGSASHSWLERLTTTLAALPEVRLLPRTTAVGSFDHNLILLLERLSAHGAKAAVRERLWQVRAKRVVLATGATERPLLFSGNDRPGIMLSSAVRTYIRRFAVCPGRRLVVATNNDDAYQTAFTALAAGMNVVAVADCRAEGAPVLAQQLREQGVRIFNGARVTTTRGWPRLRGVGVAQEEGIQEIRCDLLAVSGGFDPNIQLHAQAGGVVEFNQELGYFTPGRAADGQESVGAARGTLDAAAAIEEGIAAGKSAVDALGFQPASIGLVPPIGTGPEIRFAEPHAWNAPSNSSKAFVDLQTDVTAADLELAVRENYRSLEHVKRYTTLGMGIDQGRTGSVNAVTLLGKLRNMPARDVGTIRSRFPSFPMPLASLAGLERGPLFRPFRRLPLDDIHSALGARFEEHSAWHRPDCYPRQEEDHEQTVQREARLVRDGAGLFDASPIGKIEVIGPDAPTFLDRVYANRMSTLAVGRLRYGIMLSETGTIFDDGIAARIAQDHYMLFCTSGGAERVAAWLEELRQCVWPELRIIIAPVTGSWAVLALAGPRACAILSAAGADFEAGPGSFPPMTFRTGYVAGIPARVFRVSFTGEPSYEINVPTNRVSELWGALVGAGAVPVGLGSWLLLRLEKGHFVVGIDTDGTTTPLDIGWGHVLKRTDFFIGRPALERPAEQDADRLQLVGLRAEGTGVVPAGAHAISGMFPSSSRSEGFVTSSAFSPNLRRGVALALIRAGASRYSELTRLVSEGRSFEARIVNHCQLDPDGSRMRG
jgi:sarcosine oxidase subunit alpha